MKAIAIFDIDGCIVEDIFPNLKEEVRIEALRKKIQTIPLDSYFIKYHEELQKKGVKTYFITGRRFKDFGDETIKQLKPLKIKKNQIFFFPDNYNHSKIRYNTFKIYNILSLSIRNKDSDIEVFDDLDIYYPKLIYLAFILKVYRLRFNLVKNLNYFWRMKLKEINRVY
ncbi:MAG: hypothetical protein ACTSRH_04405 [Promethearchaeota archaeon]